MDLLNPQLSNERDRSKQTTKDGKLVPKKDIDFTDHNRPILHSNPHQHQYIPNPTGGTLQRSKLAEPVNPSGLYYEDSMDFVAPQNKL